MKELTAKEAALNWLYDWMSGFDERFMTREADSLEKLLIERDKGKWISVEDRLPEAGQETLIRIPVCERFNIENGKYKGDGVWVGAWCDRRGNGQHYKVSHWMPKPPEPPTK